VTESVSTNNPSLDSATFGELAHTLRAQLAAHTGVESADLSRHAGASLAVLRLAGSWIQPALAEAARQEPPGDLRELINGPVSHLVDLAVEAELPLSIAWGNVASVIASAAHLLADADPELRQRASAITLITLSAPQLANAWTGGLGPAFRRTSCCQIIAPGSVEPGCGDCGRRSPS
jgi:hypothetical protein